MKDQITKYALVIAVVLVFCGSGCDDVLEAGMLLSSFSGGYGGYGGDPIYGLDRWDHIVLDARPGLEPGCVDTYFYDIPTDTYGPGRTCGF